MSILYNFLDPEDPEQLRGNPFGGMSTVEGYAPQQPQQQPQGQPQFDYSEDDQDNPLAPPTDVTSGPQYSPAMQQYKTALGQMPHAENYQPSRGRRVMAAIAGGLAGIGDPKRGYEMGRTIASQPYDTAMSQWKTTMGPLEENVKLEGQAEQRGIAQQRARAYDVSAHARQTAAAATEQWRRNQEANTPFNLYTKDPAGFTKFQQAMHPQTAQRPTAFDQYSGDPQGYKEFLDAQNANKVKPLTVEDRMGLQENAARVGAKYRRPLQPKAPHTTPPAQQAKAESMAVQAILRQDPGFSDFVDEKGTIRPLHQIPSEAPQPWYKLGMGGTDPRAASLIRDKYRQFLQQVDMKKREITGQGQGSLWEIEQDDEEE